MRRVRREGSVCGKAWEEVKGCEARGAYVVKENRFCE